MSQITVDLSTPSLTMNITGDVHVHVGQSPTVTQSLARIEDTLTAMATVQQRQSTQLVTLQTQENRMAADLTSVKQIVTDIDAETNTLAVKQQAEIALIADLKAQIAAGTPVTQADLDGLSDNLSAIRDRLKVIGADPADPIPSVPAV